MATIIPTFAHPVFEELYRKDYFIDDAVLREILALGPEVAVPELLKITEATLTGFDYDNPGPNWFHNFHFPHALHLLQELAAPEAFEVYRQLLREAPENLEYWFGDHVGDELPEMLAVAAQARLPELMALLEDSTYSLHNRLLIATALLRVAQRQPAHQPEVVAFLRRYLRYIIDHAAQAALLFPADQYLYGYELDTYLGLLLAEIQDAGLRELEPEMRQLHRLKMVDESIGGGEADVTFEYSRPLAIAADIFAQYQEMRDWPDNDSPFHPDAAAIRVRKAAQEAERERQQAAYYLNSGAREPRHVTPALGRNDPCFCGSGRKYKKCCMD